MERRRTPVNIGNGKVNMKDLHDGRDHTDAYYKWFRGLVKTAETLHSLTKTDI